MAARKLSSLKARNEGKGFENVFKARCYQERVLPVQNGLESTWGKRGFKWVLVPKKSKPDFDLFWNGRAAVVDVKSTDDLYFSYSLINRDQLEKLILIGEQIPSGYVVCFRSLHKVIFFSWKELMLCRPGTSLEDKNGLYLGDLMSFSVKPIFSTFGSNDK
jgi:penicillin-binding protein-related factor A (putative recombinase)